MFPIHALISSNVLIITTGILTETLGWVYAFYVPAAISGIVALLWFGLVYDSPAQHPRIEKTEREYIENALGGNISKKKVNECFFVCMN